MDIIITPLSDLPIYKQIENCIKADILNKKMKEEELLPSIRQLAIELKVSVITIKKAYEDLEHEGFIYSFPGKGFYVAKMSDAQIQLIKQKIAKTTLQKQMDYLKSLGIDEQDILTLFQKVTK